MKPRYHQSAVNDFLQCGLKYWFRHIEKIPVKKSIPLTVGSSLDAGVTKNLLQKIESKKDLELDEVVSATSDCFDKLEYETDFKDKHPGEVKDQAISLVKAFHAEIAPKINPTSVQLFFDIDTEYPFRLGGTMDYVDGNTLCDLKSSSKLYRLDKAKKNIQSTLYWLACEDVFKKEPDGFRFDVVVKPSGKNPAKTQQTPSYKVTQDDILFVMGTVETVHNSIKAGNFLPADEFDYLCSENQCPYWAICKGR